MAPQLSNIVTILTSLLAIVLWIPNAIQAQQALSIPIYSYFIDDEMYLHPFGIAAEDDTTFELLVDSNYIPDVGLTRVFQWGRRSICI